MDFTFIIIAGIVLGIIFTLYSITFIVLSRRIRVSERRIVDIFLQKISKIPAVIEVMRPYVSDTKRAFSLITHLHSEAIIHEYSNISLLMEHNARINDQYGFLMRLSMAIPELQKDTYFIYIRDFVMSYDRMMRSELLVSNLLIKTWNRFIFIKKCTLIGFLLPGRGKMES